MRGRPRLFARPAVEVVGDDLLVVGDDHLVADDDRVVAQEPLGRGLASSATACPIPITLFRPKLREDRVGAIGSSSAFHWSEPTSTGPGAIRFRVGDPGEGRPSAVGLDQGRQVVVADRLGSDRSASDPFRPANGPA